MQEILIDFNKPSLTGKEIEYILEAIGNAHISGDGVFTQKCSQFLKDLLQVPCALITTSCTHSLELAALLLQIQPGDEVIVPSFTFTSTINAFVLRGAVPVFIDIRPDTLNLNEELLEEKISPHTRAIVVVHYAGVACKMDKIMAIANRQGIPVVEDNAHGLFGSYQGKPLGTFGRLATLSFHETKNITCGEGGALIINEPGLIEPAEIIREKGTNRSRFYRGQVDKYTWVGLGSSYLPSDILSAFLFAQMQSWQQIQAKRKLLWEKYSTSLTNWAQNNNVCLPYIPPDCQQAYHMFYLLLPNLERRQAFITFLRNKGIYAVFHYLPLHLSEMGQNFGGKPGQCPVTERVSDQLVRLPFHNGLQLSEQEQVIETINEFQV